ncbi:hypothetical protein OKW35_008686 [Paraburkholderia sp. MM5477-R1]
MMPREGSRSTHARRAQNSDPASPAARRFQSCPTAHHGAKIGDFIDRLPPLRPGFAVAGVPPPLAGRRFFYFSGNFWADRQRPVAVVRPCATNAAASGGITANRRSVHFIGQDNGAPNSRYDCALKVIPLTQVSVIEDHGSRSGFQHVVVCLRPGRLIWTTRNEGHRARTPRMLCLKRLLSVGQGCATRSDHAEADSPAQGFNRANIDRRTCLITSRFETSYRVAQVGSAWFSLTVVNERFRKPLQKCARTITNR